MNEPIKAGDQCLVVGGLAQRNSPNIGLTVKVVSLQGEHSWHGRIWKCTGEGVKQLMDNGTYQVTGWADFATSGLTKIKPDSLVTEQAEELVLLDET